MKGDRAERQKIINAHRAMETMWGDKREAKGIPAPVIRDLPPVREVKNHTPAHMLEAAVMDEVCEVIERHPKVLWAVRLNSGSAEYEAIGGPARRVQFWWWVKKPGYDDYLLGDFHIVLRDGRYGVIEVKRRDWLLRPSDERARKQGNLITEVIKAGGIGGFARCAEDAMAILDAA